MSGYTGPNHEKLRAALAALEQIYEEEAAKPTSQDTGIRLCCPSCSARGKSSGFRVRGQFCSCGWKRDTEIKSP